jgi:hypothetical protein
MAMQPGVVEGFLASKKLLDDARQQHHLSKPIVSRMKMKAKDKFVTALEVVVSSCRIS